MSGHNSSPRKLHLTRAASAALRLSASHSSRLASSDLNAASNVVDGDTSILETSTNSPTPQSAVAHSAIDIGPRTGSSHTTLEGISHHDVVAEEQLSLTELAERLPARPTKEQKDLINMPRVREITLRLGRVARLNSSRPERLIALLGQTRGEIAAPACETCASKRSGLFTSCVIIPGMFQGQCCNCRYVGRGRCSFRHLAPVPPELRIPSSAEVHTAVEWPDQDPSAGSPREFSTHTAEINDHQEDKNFPPPQPSTQYYKVLAENCMLKDQIEDIMAENCMLEDERKRLAVKNCILGDQNAALMRASQTVIQRLVGFQRFLDARKDQQGYVHSPQTIAVMPQIINQPDTEDPQISGYHSEENAIGMVIEDVAPQAATQTENTNDESHSESVNIGQAESDRRATTAL